MCNELIISSAEARYPFIGQVLKLMVGKDAHKEANSNENIRAITNFQVAKDEDSATEEMDVGMKGRNNERKKDMYRD